jgi:hypothetical protein
VKEVNFFDIDDDEEVAVPATAAASSQPKQAVTAATIAGASLDGQSSTIALRSCVMF